MPHVVDPEPAIRARVAAEQARLRAELAAEDRWWARLRLRLRVATTSARIRRGFGHASW